MTYCCDHFHRANVRCILGIMSRRCVASVVFVVLALSACSGGAGLNLDDNKLLTALDPGEQNELCQYEVDVLMGPRVVMCGSNGEVSIPNVAACNAGWSSLDSACTQTVGDAKACFAAFEEDPCDHGGSACTQVLACGG